MALTPETLSLIIHPPSPQTCVIPACRIRTTIDDFQVEEIPSYQPSGSGEHAWLWIEKRGLSSPELVHRIAKHLAVPSKDIGLAGQKDRHAVTRQFVSIPKRYAEHAAKLNSDDLSVLMVTAHQNKLRTGHLKGNRFRLILRHPSGTFSETDATQISERLTQLVSSGLPNYFGPQRFGHNGNTLTDGLRALKGRLPQNHWPDSHFRTLRRLALSAVQSAVFNLVLAERVTAGTFATAQPGDVVIRREGIKPYLFPDGADSSGVVPAGPMPGPEMLAAVGEIATREQTALDRLGLTSKDFERFAKLTSGVRRKMVEFPGDVVASLTPDSAIEVCFTLSAGTYATVVLQNLATTVTDAAMPEIVSPGAAGDQPEED